MTAAAEQAQKHAQGSASVHSGADSFLESPAGPSPAGDILALIAVAELAARYMEHPDVQAIGFSLPASAVAERLRAAIAGARA